jgi:hypothetical protein
VITSSGSTGFRRRAGATPAAPSRQAWLAVGHPLALRTGQAVLLRDGSYDQMLWTALKKKAAYLRG